MAKQDFLVAYNIKDKESYIKFITELREKLVSSSSDVVDYIFERDRAYPVISKKAGWIFVELNAEDGETTTLAIWKENLYVLGFRSQKHGWYDLGEKSDKQSLPKEYKATKLGWGVTYTSIMKLNFGDQVEKTLRSTRLGKAFAERSVRRLARYSEVVKKDDDRPTRWLRGLIVMICEAARMNPFLDTFAGGWNEGTGLTTRLAGILWNWGSMSAALLRWKDSGYSKWPVRCKHRLAHALASVHLVLNSRDAIKGSDPAWVEIFGVEFPPNFDATGITITVSDEGGNSHIIYRQGKREYQKKAISVYEWFRIRVECGGVIITDDKWDCRKPDGGYATGPHARAIFLNHSTRILVTYMVLTDAIEANVQVCLWSLDTNKYSVRGKIAARIDGFDDEYMIQLFNSQTPCNVLTLRSRSDVRVPHGKRLHITTEDLVITDASGNDVKIYDGTLTFDSSSGPDLKHIHAADFELLLLVVSWDTHQDKPIERDLTCDMGDKEEFAASIKNLHPRLYIVYGWYVHIELQVGAPDEKSSTILGVRLHDGHEVGFMNESGVWYGAGPLLSRGEYISVLLGWGNNYKDMLQASDWDDDFMDKLNPTKLTVEGFAKAAVRTLSRYPDVDVEEGDMNPRVALVGLMIMFRESKNWEDFGKFFVEGWREEMKFTPELICRLHQ